MKKQIAELIAKIIPKNAMNLQQIEQLIEVPPAMELGDFSFPCFKLAPVLKKNPNEIAKELSAKIPKNDFVQKIEAKNAYVNFYLDYSIYSKQTIEQILKQKNSFGKNKFGKNAKVMVEFPAPNTNKPLHLGHLRNASIGLAFSNILEANGFKTIKANLYNDRGVHICKSMLAYQKWGSNSSPSKKSDHFVGDFYVMFAQKAKDSPELEKEILEMLGKWEKKDAQTIALWKKMNKWAIDGMHETFKSFGLKFDVEFFESGHYDKAMPIILEGIKKRVFAKEEDGSVIADLEKFKLGKKAVLRADGTSIYLTQDLALTKLKFEKYKLQKSYWIVGDEQNLYFRQLFKIFELLQFPWAKNCFHLSYGLVNLPEGKMKTREGNVIDADDLIESVMGLARNELNSRYKDLNAKELEKRAKAIAIGAIKFEMLKTDAVKTMVFDPKKSIEFEGETSAYIQYAFARIKSILRKAKPGKADFSALDSGMEKLLVSLIARFPEKVEECFKTNSLHSLCHYLLKLAAAFNAFYAEIDVLKAEERQRNARLALIEAVSIVLENGLKLLDIEALEQM